MPDVTGPYAPGTPCWVDLMTPDQQAALDFYRDLFGWQGAVGSPETGGYAVCTLNGKPVAGIMTAMNPDGSKSEPMPPTVWTTYFATSDVEATLKAVAANGGTVMMPAMDVMTIGRMAVAGDPAGAVFGLWQARDFKGAEVVNEPGALIWNELSSSDPDTAATFYSKALGITVGAMEGAEGYYNLFVDGRPVGGLQALSNIKDLPPGTPSHWLTYFAVDDADSTVDALVRAGGSVIKPPFDMVAGRMAVLRDPQGGLFSIIKVNATDTP